MRILKKYNNRKLYDTLTRSHFNVRDLIEIARYPLDFQIIHAPTKNDITGDILSRAIYERERLRRFTDVELYKEILRHGDGSFHDFIIKRR